jgi:hypothetical protein
MLAMTKILAGGVAAAALFSAAPAAAQYYPGSPYGYGNPVGQVLNQVLGGGYGGYGGGYGNYGANSQAVVNQCVGAVQARLGGGYNNYGGGGSYSGYSYYPYANSYPGGRVLGISRIEPRSGGGLTVRGVASSGRSAGYGYGGGYGGQSQVDLTFKCKTDYRGYIVDVDIDRAQSNYGYSNGYTPYTNDYSQYGYRRY